MDNTIRFQPAQRDDLYRIAAFLDDCWRRTYRTIVSDDYLNTMSVESRHEALCKRYDENLARFLMMLDGDLLIGVTVFGTSFTKGYEDDGEISAIYLHQDYIGKGIGHRLFAKTEQALTAMGYTYFVLDVLTANTRARQFYLNHGYKVVDERTFPLGDIEYPMTILRKETPLTIRQETPADYAAVYALTKAAFAEMEHADGDEQDMVERLRKREGFLPALSLVAELDGEIVGHSIFTELKIGDHAGVILGPVSVLPIHMRQGIGSALIERGHTVAKSLGFPLSVLVGHADYYPRFGYEPIAPHGITFPVDAPAECMMVKFLDESGKSARGMAQFPAEHFPT
ncbi:MAG: GNAT family N-acetyltransferase [Oscillospiraceae bacterium]|nr:GNAT family N-acetyltransferase [Oscillospiraceae bacterium]